LEARSQKSERMLQRSILASDFCLLISGVPLTLYPSPPEGEREGYY
jgi:hypothetical protein